MQGYRSAYSTAALTTQQASPVWEHVASWPFPSSETNACKPWELQASTLSFPVKYFHFFFPPSFSLQTLSRKFCGLLKDGKVRLEIIENIYYYVVCIQFWKPEFSFGNHLLWTSIPRHSNHKVNKLNVYQALGNTKVSARTRMKGTIKSQFQ